MNMNAPTPHKMTEPAPHTAPPPVETDVVIEGARVLLPDGLHGISVHLSGGVIRGFDLPTHDARRVDAGGMVLAPALVDLHGDAFERQLMPRPGVMLPVEGAFLDTDRQLASNGIATAYHAVTLSWEPGLRSIQTGTDIHQTLLRIAGRLCVEHRLQLRWESFCFEALPLMQAALAGPLMPAIAFNDHTSMAALHPGTPLQERPYEHAPDFPVGDLESDAFVAKMAARGERAQMTASDFAALFRQVWTRRAQVPAVVAQVAAMGRAAGAPMASHDDTQTQTRDVFRSLGARICEFPMNLRTAQAARAAGDMIVFGAPNAARGGSHLGSPGAAGMIAAGLCDILASDYHYPSMLAAVARLQADGLGSLADLWPLIAANPARALHLADRGEIAPGQRADLVLLDWPENGVPVVRQTWVAGRLAYAAGAAA